MSELKLCPTPRTDAEYQLDDPDSVNIDFSRTLERELIATQLALKELVTAFTIQSVTRDDCERFGIVFKEHECGCDVCSMSSKLCPATQSTIIQTIQTKALSNPLAIAAMKGK